MHHQVGLATSPARSTLRSHIKLNKGSRRLAVRHVIWLYVWPATGKSNGNCLIPMPDSTDLNVKRKGQRCQSTDGNARDVHEECKRFSKLVTVCIQDQSDAKMIPVDTTRYYRLHDTGYYFLTDTRFAKSHPPLQFLSPIQKSSNWFAPNAPNSPNA